MSLRIRLGSGVIGVVLLMATPGCSASTSIKNDSSATASGLAQTGPFTSPEAIGLKIYSKPWNFGIRCPLWEDRHSLVVPVSGKHAYSPDEVSRLAAYANARTQFMPGPEDHEPPLPADLLREVNGTLTSATAPLEPGNTGVVFGPTCAFELELTNIGSSAMQVTKAGVRLTGPSEANHADYRLVEMCSLAGIDHYCGPQLGGAPGPCGFYAASIELREGNSGRLSQEPPQPTSVNGGALVEGQCPALIINPTQTIDLRVDLWSGQNLIFPVEPVLTVATPAGEKLVSVPAQAGRAAFANATQFTCLKFQANTFVPAYEGVAALDLDKQAPNGNWCL